MPIEEFSYLLFVLFYCNSTTYMYMYYSSTNTSNNITKNNNLHCICQTALLLNIEHFSLLTIIKWYHSLSKYLRIKDDPTYKLNGKINIKLKLMFMLKLNW